MKMSKVYRGIGELSPLCQALLKIALADIVAQGVEPLICETFRSKERQAELYAQGRTKPGKKVTWTLNSIHTQRNAIDIVPLRGGKAIWNAKDKGTLTIISAMEKYGFEAGANWKKAPDSPHFQLKGINPACNRLGKGSTNEFLTKAVQRRLKLKPDGIWGKLTDNAVNEWRIKRGLAPGNTVEAENIGLFFKGIETRTKTNSIKNI